MQDAKIIQFPGANKGPMLIDELNDHPSLMRQVHDSMAQAHEFVDSQVLDGRVAVPATFPVVSGHIVVSMPMSTTEQQVDGALPAVEFRIRLRLRELAAELAVLGVHADFTLE